MDFCALIDQARAALEPFDYDRYTERFPLYERQAAPFFAALDPAAAEQEAAALIEKLEQRRKALPRRQQRQAAEEEKRALALYLSPAARRHSPQAEAFAECLCRQWNARYPRNRFLPGDYDRILEGFDANLLGLPLRRSKKR